MAYWSRATGERQDVTHISYRRVGTLVRFWCLIGMAYSHALSRNITSTQAHGDVIGDDCSQLWAAFRKPFAKRRSLCSSLVRAMEMQSGTPHLGRSRCAISATKALWHSAFSRNAPWDVTGVSFPHALIEPQSGHSTPQKVRTGRCGLLQTRQQYSDEGIGRF